jgi:hypothetical protein
MRRVAALACALMGLVAVPSAAADGGPVPPVWGGAGVSAPGGDIAYIAVGVRGSTLVERVRRDGGAVEQTRLLRGSFGVPGVAYDGSATGLSADGRRLVLAEISSRYPVRRTRLLVLDTRRLEVLQRITLPGHFVVDAVSPTARWMYLIHYPSARSPLRYEVRAYDLHAGRLLPRPVVDPREPDEAMQGLPLTRAMSPDGRWAYTLYQRPNEAPFVHALDTDGRTAACVDLPGLARADLSGVRLAVDPAAHKVRVVSAAGTQALIDMRTFKVSAPPVASVHAPLTPSIQADRPPWAVIVPGGVVAVLVAGGLARRRRRRRLAEAPEGEEAVRVLRA